MRPSLLVLDASYTFEMIRERGLENSVLCRDLDGFFEHVWSVHPFASMLTSVEWTPRFGKPVFHELAPRHTFVEGKVGRSAALKGLFPLNFLLAQAGLFFTLRRIVRDEGIKLIRVGDPLYLGLFGLLLARVTGVPLAIRVPANNEKVRQNTNAPLFPRLFRWRWVEERIERFVLPRADLVAGPSQDNVNFAIAFGARANRVTVFRYGNLLADEHLVDPSQRQLDERLFERLAIRPKGYLLSVARLMPLKCPEDILESFAKVRSAGFEVDLVYAGEGPMRQQLESQAKMLGVQQHVRFIGNQNQRALAQLNANAAAVLSPLTGRALSESALAGAPIVAYDLDWQSDLIRTDDTGELVPFRRPDLMAESTIKILSDPEYARRVGRAARERALALLNPSALTEHERKEYSKLLEQYAKRTRMSASAAA